MGRGRPKKKESNPKESMEVLVGRAVSAFGEPYDDRQPRNPDAPSLRSVAAELNTTILRARKLLITADFFSTSLSREVQRRNTASQSIGQIMEEMGISKASVYSYIPYKGLAFNLEETTVNADRHKLFRQRIKTLTQLKEYRGFPDEMEYLWKAVTVFEGYIFHMNGRGQDHGVKFSYTVRRKTYNRMLHYIGDLKEGFGDEIEFSTSSKESTVTRATVELAYKKALEVQKREGCVNDPQKINMIGASYLYPMFVRFGVITEELIDPDPNENL